MRTAVLRLRPAVSSPARASARRVKRSAWIAWEAGWLAGNVPMSRGVLTWSLYRQQDDTWQACLCVWVRREELTCCRAAPCVPRDQHIVNVATAGGLVGGLCGGIKGGIR